MSILLIYEVEKDFYVTATLLPELLSRVMIPLIICYGYYGLHDYKHTIFASFLSYFSLLTTALKHRQTLKCWFFFPSLYPEGGCTMLCYPMKEVQYRFLVRKWDNSYAEVKKKFLHAHAFWCHAITNHYCVCRLLFMEGSFVLTLRCSWEEVRKKLINSR